MICSVLRNLVLVLVISFSNTHPAFQHHFNNIVDSNPCLKRCMDQATGQGMELNLLKTANISGYLLNLDSICDAISTARSCISGCGVQSNPFALETMTTICSDQSLSEVASISACLAQQGDQILEECSSECGDFEQINSQVHDLTKTYRLDRNEPLKLAEVMAQINRGCSALKCNNRCATRMLTEQCNVLDNGKDVGSLIKALLEKVLVAQRMDLERMKLVDSMAQSMPPQCNFMYMPEVMFNSSKDEMALRIIEEVKKSEQLRGPDQDMISNNGEGTKKQELNLAVSQIQTQLLRKQLHLLDIQEQNLIKESKKLSMEMQLLARKRAQNNFEDAMVKQLY